jgi:anti-sigma regulatory factor (Ser/Thr protein kinase)
MAAALAARLVAGPNAPAAARERAADFFSDVAVGEDAALLRLLVSEIVTEAVERAGSARNVIELRLERDERRLHIEVSHTGSPNASSPAEQELRHTILEEATAAWGDDADAGGRLWFELDLPAVADGRGWARTSDLSGVRPRR